MTHGASLAVDVGDGGGGVSAFQVDVDLGDPAVVSERHPVRIVFEDRRAAILADIERLVDRIDEGNRVIDGGSATSAPSTFIT